MLSLEPHHIIDLYCVVDELVPKMLSGKRGRPLSLQSSETITILIWDILVLRQPTLKDLYTKIIMYHTDDFPRLSSYNSFLDACHRSIPLLGLILGQILSSQESTRILDSTMLEVCTLERADHHKVAQGIAQFGKNHQGWHYGFKLHASISLSGSLCATYITPANVHDAQVMPKILNKHAKYTVGDSHYGAKVMRQHIWETYGTIIITPPHFTQKRKIMTEWQHLFLNVRSKIESVFDYLKNHLGIASSFPRSINGYLLHYLKTLVGYQFLVRG
jgi:hypothetical protein